MAATNINKVKKIKKIITVSGKEVDITTCKKLKEGYFIIDEECVLIGDRWFAKIEPAVKFDHEKKEWVYDKYGKCYNGIIGFNNDEPIMGYFSSNSYTNCTVYMTSSISYMCIDYHLLNDNFIEQNNREEMIFYNKAFLGGTDIIRIQTPKKSTFENQGYNLEDCVDFASKRLTYNKFNLKIERSTYKAVKLVGDLTFGCENETVGGLLPKNIQNQLGIVICKDGSIKYSPEYVTVPYKGVKGLQSLKQMFFELNKRCTTSIDCSLHYHFGNMRKDREFIIALHKLFYNIQEELFLMFPYYKRFYKNFKKQDYNKTLENIISTYDKNSKETFKEFVQKEYLKLYSFLNLGVQPDSTFNRKNKNHVKGNTKWNIPTRYMAINFIPLLFSNRETIEFRMSHSVLNSTKGLNWFFICVAIIKYTEKNSVNILSSYEDISLKDVLDVFEYPYNEYLHKYYLNRVEFFKKQIREENYTSENENRIERNFNFSACGINDIF